MAFTTCKEFNIVNAPVHGAFYYFYPEDIAILLNQSEAVAVACVGAKPQGENDKIYPVLVAVKNTNAEIDESDLLTGDNHMMTLPCPPWGRDDYKGGQYLPDARQNGTWP